MVRELKGDLQIARSIYGYRWYYVLPFHLTEGQILYRHYLYLRTAEYAYHRHNPLRKLYLLRLTRLQVKYGLSIPMDVVGKGFHIQHLGSVIINGQARIGEYCKVHPGVCIGANHDKAPIIGDHVYIGPGAKVFGDIQIADEVQIGANAVVTKSCQQRGAHLAGVPAQVV